MGGLRGGFMRNLEGGLLLADPIAIMVIVVGLGISGSVPYRVDKRSHKLSEVVACERRKDQFGHQKRIAVKGRTSADTVWIFHSHKPASNSYKREKDCDWRSY